MELQLDIKNPHRKTPKSFEQKEYVLLGAGPINCSLRVLKAFTRQPWNPMSLSMFQLMDEIKVLLQYVFQTKNPLTLVSQTSGNGGNEAIITNLLDPGQKLVIAIGGTWGEKVLDMAQRYNYDTLPLRKPPGEIFTLEELETAVKTYQADLLFVTHGESTGGILQKVEGLGPMCHKYNCLLAVDAVVSAVVDPLFVDRWEIDAVNAGSQKGIGTPPGLSLLSFSPRAEQRMRIKKTQPPYYLDILRLSQYWNCFGEPRAYHYTFSSNLLAALREALAEICEVGLVEMWTKHKRIAEEFWKRLEGIGLKSFVEKPENRFHGVTCVRIPSDINQMEFLKYLNDKFDIDITPGYGPTLNAAIRVGLMNINCTPEMVDFIIEAFQDGLNHFRGKK